MGRIQRFGPVARTAADFIEAEVARDGEQPGGEFGGDSVAVGRFINLKEYVLREVFGLRGIPECAVNDIRDRLLVLVYQFFKSLPVASFDAKHQTGVGIGVGRHGRASYQKPPEAQGCPYSSS